MPSDESDPKPGASSPPGPGSSPEKPSPGQQPDPGPAAGKDLRRMSMADLERSGQESLRGHLHDQALVAHQKYGPLTAANLQAFLHDPACLRHPVRLAFEIGGMAMHQFAQPDIDCLNTEKDGRVLYLRPSLRDRPDLVPLAVAFMVPVINYGEVISDEHCLLYGATLLGLMEEEFYQRLCALADFCGAEPRSSS